MATIAIGVIAPTPGENLPQRHPAAPAGQAAGPSSSPSGVPGWVEPPAFGPRARMSADSADPDLTPVGAQQPPTAAQFLAPSVDLGWPAANLAPVGIDLILEQPAAPQPAPEPSGLAVLAAAVCGVAVVRWRSGAQSRRLLPTA